MLISRKFISISKSFPLPYFLPVFCSPISPWFVPDFHQSNYFSVYPPIFDTLEWMKMNIGLPISVIMNMCYQNSSLTQMLKTWTLLQREPSLLLFCLQCIDLQKYLSLNIHQADISVRNKKTWNLLHICKNIQVSNFHLYWQINITLLQSQLLCLTGGAISTTLLIKNH